MEDVPRLRPQDHPDYDSGPAECGCDEAPECTHNLYWWKGFKAGQESLRLAAKAKKENK